MLSAARGLTAGPTDLVGALAGWWAAVTIFPAIVVAWPLVAILFPDGRLPGRNWRWPVAIVLVGVAVIAAINAITIGPVSIGLPDNPFGVLPLSADAVAFLGLVGAILVVLSLVLALTAIGVRWRRGERLMRAQLKWLLGALAVGGILFPLGFGGGLANGMDLVAVATQRCSIAIGIAVMRYHLYEIDRVISRTISYGVITAVLVGVFAAVVVSFQANFAQVTGGDTIPVAASTLVVFALFQPVRRRVQSVVDRRFDRARYDAEQTIADFAVRLKDNVDLESLATEVRDVVGATIAPASVGVWLRQSRRATSS